MTQQTVYKHLTRHKRHSQKLCLFLLFQLKGISYV
ncbi:hypothetical protein KEN51_CDS0264 [Pseudomonas phage vB_Pae10145-KEN51]|nr:hypothetical protein [Pseudomonas phage PhiPizzaParty]WRQ05707.1 hypothetical protein IPCDMZAV_CDS0184 [Pseudomonas phage 6B]WRQ06204.1 hypothetical protein QAMIJHJT_CDS0273 [Pseudomonas phage 9-Ps-8B]WRQ06612.1 hypothetical protein FOPPYZMZ_CDS0272 [Pseudomonas phage 9Ps-7B]WRQ06963.1 hypothetical protein ZBUARNPM_CDS0214 [Pseudomonas phage 14Ps5-6]